MARGRRIPVPLQALLRALHRQQGFSLRCLARKYRLHRATVTRYAREQCTTPPRAAGVVLGMARKTAEANGDTNGHAGGLDPHRLAALRAWAGRKQEIADEAGPFKPRQVHKGELDADAEAARDLVAEVDRLTALTEKE
jgi:hypothetical protein